MKLSHIQTRLYFGWYPDLPDLRDYTITSPIIKKNLKFKKTGVRPKQVDLRAGCTAIDNQGKLGSCTANAGVGLLEYYEKSKSSTNSNFNGSRLFLYKTTRDLLGKKGDTGAPTRATLKAMLDYGVCREKLWPYKISRFDEQPPNECYREASEYQILKYYTLDSPGSDLEQVLINVKDVLAIGTPIMFGFSVFSSIATSKTEGMIPFPNASDRVLGGHAVMAVGYDDKKQALLIRNSWGTAWGMDGYGYLPYKYVTVGLALDFWALIEAETGPS